MPIVPISTDRARFALRYAARHLFVSAAVALLAAALVFRIWYPAPASDLFNVDHIYAVVLLVDVVCGPLLTLILASPFKGRRELIFDLSLIGLIQLAALGYGLFALDSARPVGYVFEQDRLVLVARNELYLADCEKTQQRCLPLPDVQGIGMYLAQLEQSESLPSLELSLQGVSPAMRPITWRPWNWRDAKLQMALRPLAALRVDQKERLAALKGEPYLLRSELRYLPLVSAKTLNWIGVFNDQGEWVDALPIDGFQ